MKGYAKGNISKEIISRLEDIIYKSDEFYFNVYSTSYKKKEIKRCWLFFKKEIYIPDILKAMDEANKYNCDAHISIGGSCIWFTQDNCIDQYRKIVNLSKADDYYLDDELITVLNELNPTNNT